MDSATPEASRTPAPLKGLRRSLAQAPYSWSLPVVSALFAPSSIMRVGCDSGRDDVSRRCLLPRSTGLSKIGVWSAGSLLRSTRPSSSFVPRRFRPTPPRWRPGRPLCRSLRRLLSTGMILGPTPPRVNRPPRNPSSFSHNFLIFRHLRFGDSRGLRFIAQAIAPVAPDSRPPGASTAQKSGRRLASKVIYIR